MTQKQEIRLDYHFADTTTPAFFGIFVTTKAAYECTELPDAGSDGEDVVKMPADRFESALGVLLQDAVRSACNDANASSPTSGEQALSAAAKSLEDSGMAKDPEVAKLVQALLDASKAMMDKDEVQQIQNYIASASWDHIFVGTRAETTRWVYDNDEEQLVGAQVLNEGKWVDIDVYPAAHLLESIHHNEAIEKAQDFGLIKFSTKPSWQDVENGLMALRSSQNLRQYEATTEQPSPTPPTERPRG